MAVSQSCKVAPSIRLPRYITNLRVSVGSTEISQPWRFAVFPATLCTRAMNQTPTPSHTRKYASLLLKLAFCAAAVWYLSDKVTFYDYVRLRTTPEQPVRLLSESESSLVVTDGSTGQITIPRSELATKDQLAKGQRDVERGIRYLATTANGQWAALAFIFLGPTTLVLAWRLQLLLATQDIAISFRDSLLLTFAGNFFNFAMPGTTGGDIYKAYHIARITHKRTEGITVVLLDRVIGLVSFLLLAAGTILALWRTDLIGFYGRWVGYLTLAFFVAAGIFFSRRVRQRIRFDELLIKLPFGDKLKRIDDTAFSFRFHRGSAALALVTTIASHFMIISSMYFAARSLGINRSSIHSDTHLYWAVMLASVVGFLLAAVPISIQGFGLLEAVFYKVLVDGGWATGSQMLALTLGFRLIQIAWSLPGVIVPWLGFARPAGQVLRSEGEPSTSIRA